MNRPLHAPETCKLGRAPHNPEHVARALKLHAGIVDLSRIPTTPAAFDWSEKDGGFFDYPMLGNDRYRDCVFASACNDLITKSGQTSVPLAITEDDALDAYHRFTGFDPAVPSSDNGAVMMDVANRAVGGELIAGQRLRAFLALDPRNTELMDAVANLFGGLWLGWALPMAWQDMDIWDVSPTGDTSGIWAPGSWGGHATHGPERSPALNGIITWTIDKAHTPPAERAYCVEAYALLWERQWTVLTGDRCPAGVDVQQLIDTMGVIRP